MNNIHDCTPRPDRPIPIRQNYEDASDAELSLRDFARALTKLLLESNLELLKSF